MAETTERMDFEAPIVELEKRIKDLEKFTSGEKIDCSEELTLLRQKLEEITKETYALLTPWQRVQIARHPKRPYVRDYIDIIFTDFIELHGDRRFGDDPAMVAGFAKLDGKTVAVIGHQKKPPAVPYEGAECPEFVVGVGGVAGRANQDMKVFHLALGEGWAGRETHRTPVDGTNDSQKHSQARLVLYMNTSLETLAIYQYFHSGDLELLL